MGKLYGRDGERRAALLQRLAGAKTKAVEPMPGRAKAPDAVREGLFPGADRKLKPCRPPKGKTSLRDCHVELDWLGPKNAAKAGTTPGPHLRFCSSKPKKPAPIVPVSSHKEAQELADAFCRCVGKDGKKKGLPCATMVVVGKKAPKMLGGMKKKGKKRR